MKTLHIIAYTYLGVDMKIETFETKDKVNKFLSELLGPEYVSGPNDEPEYVIECYMEENADEEEYSLTYKEVEI